MEEYSPMSIRGPAELTGLGSHEVSCTWIGPPLIGPEPGYCPVIGHPSPPDARWSERPLHLSLSLTQ